MEPGNVDHCPHTAPTPGCSFVARVAFTYGDLVLAAGDPFPYAQLGMTEDAAWNFWRSAMIEVDPATPAAEPATPSTRSRAPTLPPPQRSSKR